MESYNFASPYGKSAQQYPSQSQDYISLEFGGLGPAPQEASQQNNRTHYMTSTPAKYCGNSPNFASRGGKYRGSRGRGTNRFCGENSNRRGHGGFGHHPYHQQQQNYNNYGSKGPFQNRSGGGGGGKHLNNKHFSNKEFDFNCYFHPTMLEDPWHDLMERQNALRQSEISFASTIQKDSSDSDSAIESEQKEDHGCSEVQPKV